MKQSISYVTIVVVLVGSLGWPGPTTCTVSGRNKRGFKDSFSSKDTSTFTASPQSKFQELLDKLNSIESTLKTEQSNLTTLNNAIANISTIIQKNEKSIEKLNSKVQVLESQDNNNIPDDVDSRYWNSSDTCGGVLTSQTGIVSYAILGFSSAQVAVGCVWTIQTNYRSRIKFATSHFDKTVVAQVTEFFIAKNGTSHSMTTKLAPATKYVLQGPVIIVSVVTTKSVTFSYEGFGRVIHEDTLFRHHHFKQHNGSFHTQIGTSEDSDKQKVFTTISINTNAKALTKLVVNFSKNCQDGSRYWMQAAGEEVYGINAGAIDCCPPNSSTKNCTVKRYTTEGYFAITHSSLKGDNDQLGMIWSTHHGQSESLGECGGVLRGASGRIQYKRYSTYSNNERCIWVIYPFPKRAVRIMETAINLESSYDRVTVLEVDRPDKMFKSTIITRTTIGVGKFNFTGRVVIVSFYTDSSIVRQGFEIAWTAVGPSEINRSLENEKLLHSTKDGLFPLSIKGNGFILFLATNLGKDASSSKMTITKKMGHNRCRSSTLGIFGTTGGQVLSSSRTISICQNSSISSGPHTLSSPDGISGLFLENTDSADSEINLEVKFEFVLPPSTDVTPQQVSKCGGIIHGAQGRLSYKLDRSYENNERCIWILHSPGSSSIDLNLLKNGFESCCDYLLVDTVNTLTGTLNPNTTTLSGESSPSISGFTGSFPGQVVIITFRSDTTVPGLGFLLQYTGRGTAPSSTLPTYTLYHKDDLMGTFTFSSPIVAPFVQGDSSSDFRDDSVEETWYWESYEELKSSTTRSVTNFSKPITTKDIVILVFSGSLADEEGTGSAVSFFNVTVDEMDFGTDENCTRDSLKFYTSPSREGFTLAENYPKQECTKIASGKCENCQKSILSQNDSIPHTFGTAFRAFVAIYKPVKAKTGNQTFSVKWDSSAGCGGVVHETFETGRGRIAYKLGSRYKNMEQCIWTLHFPRVSKIQFELSSNGFEACCDMLILNSLDSKTGSIGNSVNLKRGQTTAVMNGPVVFVTFRSDGSITGEGFGLNFSPISNSNSSNSDEDEYSYYHYSSGHRNSTFQFPVGEKRNMDVGSNIISTFTFTPGSIKNDSLLRFKNKINIDLLNLFVDNNTCASDTLKFYETLTSSGFNETKSYAINVSDSASCNGNGTWECKGCLINTTKLDQLQFWTSYPSFIAIFKSGSSIGEDQKGFKITWIDRPRVADDASTSTTSRSLHIHHIHNRRAILLRKGKTVTSREIQRNLNGTLRVVNYETYRNGTSRVVREHTLDI